LALVEADRAEVVAADEIGVADVERREERALRVGAVAAVLDAAQRERERPLVPVMPPVNEGGLEVKVARQRLRLEAVAAAHDRRDEAEDRGVAHERRGDVAEVEREVAAGDALRGVVDDVAGERIEEQRLDLVLDALALVADLRLHAARGTERILQ